MPLILFDSLRPCATSLFDDTRACMSQHTRAVLAQRAIDTGNDPNSGKLQESTGILIAAGLICFILLLLGFWSVARWRPLEPSPVANVSPRHVPNMSGRWGSWMLWRRNASNTTPNLSSRSGGRNRRISHVFSTLAAPHMRVPTVTVLPAIVTTGEPMALTHDLTTAGFQFIPGGRRSTTFSGITTPSLMDSVTLNEFHDGSYELDYEVELQMTKNIHHTVTPMVEGCAHEECATAGDNGSVLKGEVVRESTESQSKAVATGLDVDIPEVDKVAMGRQALQ
ncbi:hypothetical protein F5I97DRAFT_1881667 [Phlebopus sp. FC_14]|nr:hypothetical protein F5I97DRAFT_1881667 [Phlebopus sp. FC_14]